MKGYINKKVLLRERKRHTARRLASARYAALSVSWRRGRGVAHSVLDGGMVGTPFSPGRGDGE